MKNRFLSLLCVLALCLGLLPATALAAEGAPNSLYVGDQQVIKGNNPTFWTTDKSTGGLTKYEGNDDSWNVKYDPNTATLTLNWATINGAHDATSLPYGSGIYALCSSNQSVALTIELIGKNTIKGNYGIYVDAQQGVTVGTNASLLIQNSSGNGILEVSGSSYGIYVKSGTGDASLTIKDASVVASCRSSYGGGYAGVCVHSGSDTTSSPKLSLAVDGGSLTTIASEGNDGIQFYVGAHEVTSETTSLSVTSNAIVDARNGGISASGVSVNPNVDIGSTDSTGGIVWNGSEGTVYGDVELQEDLEIGEGESLTLDNGASLNAGNYDVIVDGGTLDDSIKNSLGDSVIYKVTKVELNKTSLTLGVGKSETLTATITPSNATNPNVTWSSSDGAVATVDANGNVTAVAPGTAAITVTTDDGNKTAVCTVTVSKRSSSGSSGGSDSEPSYSPILETEGEGTVKVDPRTPGQGDAVTVTPTPDRGWDVGSVTVTDRNGREIDVTERRNSTWTFEQPRGRVTIAVTFVPAGGTAPFADVPEGHWAEAAIRYVWENGLMNGTSAASFNPGGTVSRQQVWMILARMAGADPADMAAAKAWAVDSGISDGTSPGGAVTRQQFAALLYRFAVMMGYDVSVGESTNILSYADAFDAAEYAIPALQWACGAGIIHGTGDGSTLSPQGTATRAQAAVMLQRFCELNK